MGRPAAASHRSRRSRPCRPAVRKQSGIATRGRSSRTTWSRTTASSTRANRRPASTISRSSSRRARFRTTARCTGRRTARAWRARSRSNRGSPTSRTRSRSSPGRRPTRPVATVTTWTGGAKARSDGSTGSLRREPPQRNSTVDRGPRSATRLASAPSTAPTPTGKATGRQQSRSRTDQLRLHDPIASILLPRRSSASAIVPIHQL